VDSGLRSRRNFIGVLAFIALITAFARSAAADEAQLGQPETIPAGRTEMISISANRGPSLASAVAALSPWRILPGATLVLHLEDGVYKNDRTLHIDHPDGARIQIVGNTHAPEKVRLVWSANTDGIYVGTSNALGRLDGVTLYRNVPGGNDNGASDNACGLLAENAGVLQAGPAVVVDGFYYGAQARYGGVIRAHGVLVRHAGDAGFFAYNGGHIEAQGSRAEDSSDAKLSLGSGYVAEYGGSLDATGATAVGNALAGFTALSGGSIVANDATATRNRRYGFYARTNGTIVAHHATASQSGQGAFDSAENGSITGLEEH